ncbi:DNA-directed RNA polymerase subunit beta [Frankliniella fusca]|uniref:DNA-directed RNA polymerase subunit beta n=1 Tax=Frankliniella fusca TaxID=407009 RepID=A0AAE1HRY8_9NEOP|nr:DNA-directed RNA polymerase subunit beta [Frankliniella fusca]
MADQPLPKKAKKKLMEMLSSSSSFDPGNVTPSTVISFPSNPVIPLEVQLAVVPSAGEVHVADVVDPLQVTKSLGSEMDSLEENPLMENINLLSQSVLSQTPNLHAHQNVPPPQIAESVPFIPPHDHPLDHSISVAATPSFISSLSTGYTVDWHHFVTPSNEEPDNIYQEINVNLNASPLLIHEDNESSPHQPDITILHQALYQNSSITLHDSLVSVLSFAQSSHITELLDLCHLLLPAPNLLPSSKHSYFKYFENDDTELNTFFYCNQQQRQQEDLQYADLDEEEQWEEMDLEEPPEIPVNRHPNRVWMQEGRQPGRRRPVHDYDGRRQEYYDGEADDEQEERQDHPATNHFFMKLLEKMNRPKKYNEAPKYDGEADYSVYQLQFQTVAEANDWDDKDKKTALVQALTGNATDVIANLQHQEVPITFKSLDEALVKTFSKTASMWERKKDFNTLTQEKDQSIRQFARQVERLGRSYLGNMKEETYRKP